MTSTGRSGRSTSSAAACSACSTTRRRHHPFARSFGFPTKLDPEKVKAELVDGLLTVRLAKVPEAQPRRITVGTK